MKQLTTLALFTILIGCVGVEPAPSTPTKTTQDIPKVAKREFSVGDRVSVDTGSRVIRGTIIALRPACEWENTTTGAKRISYAYRVKLTIPGKIWVGLLPEFMLEHNE